MVPVTGAAWAALLGGTLGLGLWTLATLLPRVSAPRLAERLAPHVVDVSDEARRVLARRPAEPLPILGLLGAPVIARARSALDRALGGRDTIEWRLRVAGIAATVERYRTQQLAALGLGGAVGAVAGVIVARGAAGQVGLPLLGAAAGLLARDWLLARRARLRLARLREELPTILEFLMLSLSSGEGIHDALFRVARVGSGELARELAGVVAETRTGVPLASALGGLTRDLRLAPLTRAVEHLTAALERGSPLADVLRAQAEDCRNDAKRDLLESAGRREIGMLVPLVFLILPTTVVIAVFPGLLVLQTGF